MTVGVGPWVCTLPCGSAQLCLSCPILVSQPRSSPNLMFPWPVVQCTAPVRCLCARCMGALPVCTAWVPPVRAASALAVRAAWALPVRAVWALGLGAACARCMGTACVRCLCTQPGHSQPDHGIAPMITNRCVQALNAPCPKSVYAAFTALSVLRPSCWPSEPTSESHIRSHM